MPRALLPCSVCAELVLEGSCSCPHCGEKHPCHARQLSRAAALLGLGLALSACETKDGDSAGDSPTYTTYTGTEADYSAVETHPDDDGDGYEADIDCDDSDPNIHPEAVETPGDGVDSNCNEDDDT